jgi:hypothetical protein
MSRTAWLWIIALLVTLLSARWQRATGPTHPLPGRTTIGGAILRTSLERTHKGPGDQRVEIGPVPGGVTGVAEWRPWGSTAPWTQVPMRLEGGRLVADLPHQPPAGKLWYRVRLACGAETVLIPPRSPAAIRFTGAVPLAVLLPHILFMFAAMLLSTRAGLEAFRSRARLGGLTGWTLGTLLAGGIVLGCFVTHYAFGPWWTGFPAGNDLTDNKTLIALVTWIVAAIAVARARGAKACVLVASLVTLTIFAIPHSWTGSEPTYARLDAGLGERTTPVTAPREPRAH